MLNHVVLIGNIVRSIEAVELGEKDNTVLAINNSIAINEGKDSEGYDLVSFIDFKAFGKTAELISTYCEKGSRIAIEGRLKQRRFTRKDGSNGSAVEVIVNNVQFLDSKKEEAEADEPVVLDTAPEKPVTPKKVAAKTYYKKK